MKYIPLDLSMMKPEPFPYPVMMRSDLYPKRQPSGQAVWGGLSCSICGALQRIIRQCWKKAEQKKVVMTILSVAGACAFGLLAVGVFWLAVEMDNSDLQASQSSCSIRP